MREETKTSHNLVPPPGCDERLRTIYHKVQLGDRLSREEGIYLFSLEENEPVRHLADHVRRRAVGDTVYYASTFYIHPTNLCELSCPMCSYYAKPGWESAWFTTPEEAERRIRGALHRGLNEIHVVGGLWRDCDLPYYQDLFTRIKAIDPELHIKALTPVEYDFLARLHDISIEEVFLRMMDWGLGSLPGGGAEVLVEKVRKQVAPQKIDSARWLEVHRIAHELGLRSNATVLFGHVEDYEDLVDHMLALRALQDDTGGFNTFVPLLYHLENNALGKRKKRIKPKNIARLFAVARLLLDNIPHLKALWNYLGVETALQLLDGGANDLSSTNTEERIIRMAGGIEVDMTAEMMDKLIREAGRHPRRIHSGYAYDEELCCV